MKSRVREIDHPPTVLAPTRCNPRLSSFYSSSSSFPSSSSSSFSFSPSSFSSSVFPFSFFHLRRLYLSSSLFLSTFSFPSYSFPSFIFFLFYIFVSLSSANQASSSAIRFLNTSPTPPRKPSPTFPFLVNGDVLSSTHPIIHHSAIILTSHNYLVFRSVLCLCQSVRCQLSVSDIPIFFEPLIQ